MTSQPTLRLPALRTQQLLLEFAALKHARLDGIYMSLGANDARRWAGVLFVRKGPYASAVLCFELSFPVTYPTHPPLVTFTTDIFHPLVTPSTIQSYSTAKAPDVPPPAANGQGLVAGGFSLRHGFAGWFETADDASRRATANSPDGHGHRRRAAMVVSVVDLLRYMRSTFDDGAVLDAVPLSAAADTGAWRAWRAHRRRNGPEGALRGLAAAFPDDDGDGEAVKAPYEQSSSSTRALKQGRRSPPDWDWDGVWEERVRRCVQYSTADPVLYGRSGAKSDLIQFWKADAEELQAVKDAMRHAVAT